MDMTVERFWAMIDDARKTHGLEGMAESLAESLSVCDERAIFAWAHIFDEYHRVSYQEKLWAAAYIILGGCSDDGFDYFRAWLIAQGKAVFLAALRDPDSLADVAEGDDVEYEDMLSVAAHAWFIQQGAIKRDYRRFHEASKSYPLPEDVQKALRAEIQLADDMNAKWTEDDESLERLLPKLYDAFN